MDQARLSQGNSKPRDKGQAAGVSKLSLLGRMIQDLCLYVCMLMCVHHHYYHHHCNLERGIHYKSEKRNRVKREKL